MSLTDGDVALLARQAVDLLDPTIDVSVEPTDPVDPYRRGAPAWLVVPRIDGQRSFGIHLDGAMTPVEALAHLIDGLGSDFPACPGHAHRAAVGVDGADVVFTCPDTGAEVGRVHPAVP